MHLHSLTPWAGRQFGRASHRRGGQRGGTFGGDGQGQLGGLPGGGRCPLEVFPGRCGSTLSRQRGRAGRGGGVGPTRLTRRGHRRRLTG